MNDDQLLHLLIQLLLLVSIARLGGEVAVRLRLPEVVGEIMFGVALGPSVLGQVWGDAYRFLFPGDGVQASALAGVTWIGVLFLVAISGLETHLGMVRGSGKAAVASWLGGFLVPFVCGLAVGFAVPSELMGPGTSRTVFALFLAIAMSISAIPVIARLLLDLNAYRSRVGAITISAAIADDTLGWILTGIVSGIVTGTGSPLSKAVGAVLGTLAFVVLAFTIGQRIVRLALRSASHVRIPFGQTTVLLSVVVGGAIVTQLIGIHAVLGAFVGALLVRRAAVVGHETVGSIHRIGMGFFVPLFFAYTGSRVDLTTLHGSALGVTAIAVVVAVVSKLVGGGFGARIGGLPRWEAISVGIGLNSRGAMGLVIAAIGLSLGILSSAVYAMLVSISVVTSIMAGPMLRVSLARAGIQGSDRTGAWDVNRDGQRDMSLVIDRNDP